MAVFAVCACECAYAQKKEKDPTKQDWAKFYRYEKLNAEVLASGVRPDVVFMGNSITQNWAKFNPDFFKNNNFLGRGIGVGIAVHGCRRGIEMAVAGVIGGDSYIRCFLMLTP